MRVLVWLLLVILPCFALHESDAGKIDWYKKLVGLPRIETSAIAPRFEQAAGRKPSSFIVTVSSSNVLAAINAAGGKVVWRHVLDAFDLVGVYRCNPGFVVTLSGPGGAHLRSYDTTTGHLIFDSLLHMPNIGWLPEPPNIGQDVEFSADKSSDLFALTQAYAVRRVDGLTGQTKWTWMSGDQSSSVLFCKLVTTEVTLYLIGLTKALKGYTLHVVALDSSTGATLSSIDVSSSVDGPADFIALTSSRTPQPILVWLDNGYIKSVVLTPELKLSPRTIRDDIYKELRDIGIADAGIIIATKQNKTSHVIRVDKGAQGVQKVWEFTAASSDQSESVYSGGVDKAGQPYVACTYWSYVMRAASFQLYAANGAEGKGMLTGFTFAFDPITHGSIRHFAFEVANPQPYTFVARSMFTTSTGALQLWQQDTIKWTREESLTEIQSVEFIDLPEKKVIEHALNGHNFVTRFLRQIRDVQGFPAYAAGFGRRFLTGSSGASGSVPGKGIDGLWRDAFGFRKLLVVSSSTGKVFGIDTAQGNIVWSRLLVQGSHKGVVKPFKHFPVATASDGKQPEIVLLGHSHSPSDDTSVVLYHFEALTGLDILGDGRRRDILTGVEAFKGTAVDGYLLRGANKTVVVISDDHKVHLYPNDPVTRASFSSLAPSLHLVLENMKHHLTGYQIYPAMEEGAYGMFIAWTVSLGASEHIQAIIRRPHEPIASLGKVLGDRSTLYKYLNPNLIAVFTTTKTVLPQCSVYLVDGAKGTVLYRATFPPASKSCNIHATLTENWFVYHYYDEAPRVADGAKGYRVVSVEMYEGTGTDNKTRSADLSSYSYDSSLLTLFQQSFVYPHGISALTTTSTKFGISMKDIIVANVKRQIQSVPRRYLDPRRPKHKPTVHQQEEWLIQYDPVIPDDPRRVISHNYMVEGTQKIVTSPALLESTSIVLAYGLDLFLTRVAPSNTFDVLSESFNKLQLVLTVVALAMGIIVTKPMVHRKQMRQRWYYS